MTAIGKLLVVLVLVAGLAMLTWSVGVYVQRPTWFAPVAKDRVPQPFDQNTFAELKTEITTLQESVKIASDAWGVQRTLLENREIIREKRRQRFAERLRWARTGNPADLIDPADKNSGKGFYQPVVDPVTLLYDVNKLGPAVKGTDGTPLRGAETLLAAIDQDVETIVKLNKEIEAKRDEYTKLSADLLLLEARSIKMGEIRDSVQAELFFLSTFEVNVFETRETVLRRERQLRARLKQLGVDDP